VAVTLVAGSAPSHQQLKALFRIERVRSAAMFHEIEHASTSPTQDAARIALGALLIFAGTSHLTFAREPFKAQVPRCPSFDPDAVVLHSGIAEIALGSALALLPGQKRTLGCLAALFFAAVFPGNIAQYRYRRDAFGLDTDRKRFARLFFQPVFIAWALWSSRPPKLTRASSNSAARSGVTPDVL
jgi:uncharacterized membrane protein